MTIEDHLRRFIGDLVFTLAKVSAELDAAKEQLAAKALTEKKEVEHG